MTVATICSSWSKPTPTRAEPVIVEHALLPVDVADRAAFEAAGFHGVEILERQAEPWQTIGHLEFRSLTVRAFKPQPTSPRDFQHAVIYRGPWQSVMTDFGIELRRGERIDVSDSEFSMLAESPYREEVVALPNANVELGAAPGTTTFVSLDVVGSSRCC